MKTKTAVAAIPPLSKSRYATMACQKLYEVKNIQGIRTESAASDRGSRIHDRLQEYVGHLVAKRKKSDPEFLDQICAGESEEVAEVMSRIRDSYFFNPDHIVDTELHITLDELFDPCDPSVAAYEGTLDVVLLPEPTAAEIIDYKSYFAIVDADSFEARMYALLLMSVNPAIQTVKFVLDFVRYATTRQIVFTREELPKLQAIALRERARQIALHQQTEFGATPGKQCCFCPVMMTECPIMHTNPYSDLTPEARVAFAVWLKEATKENTRILKDWATERVLIYKDANEVAYTAGFVKQEKRSYPLDPTYDNLMAWGETNEADARDLLRKLTVGGLSSLLKAKKRAPLNEKMQKIAQITTGTKFTVGRQGDEDEDDA